MKQVKPYNEALGKKVQVEEMFDNIAHRYDFLNHLLSANIDKIWRWKAVNILKRKQPVSVLDVATGTGDFAIANLRAKPKEVIGVDISNGMLEVGRKKILNKKLDHLITLKRADSEDLPFEDNRFDAITVGFGVRNFENLMKGVEEMYRVLKPGGTLIVLEFSRPSVFPVKQLFYFYFNYVCPIIGKTFSKDDRAYSYLPESVQTFPEGKAFIELLGKAGFKSVQCQKLTFGISSIYVGKKS